MPTLPPTTTELGPDLSLTALSGMTWPSAGLHAPDASSTILPKQSIFHLSPAIWGDQKYSISQVAATKASLGTVSVSHSTISTFPLYQSRVMGKQVPTAITVAKSCSHTMKVVPGASETKRPQLSIPLATTAHITRLITWTGTPATANTSLKAYNLRFATPIPTISPPASTAPPKPQQPSDPSPNHGAIIGGIIGALLAFLGLLILIKHCRPSHKKSQDIEKGHRHCHRHRDTHAVLDEVQRRNQKRHHVHYHRADTAAVNLAHARNWEHGFDTNRFRPAPHTRPDSVSSLGMSPEELAQTHAWNKGPAVGVLYGSSGRRHVPVAYPHYPVAMLTRKPVVQAGRMLPVKDTGRKRGGSRKGRGPVRSVSPLNGSETAYARGCGGGDYGDVLPIVSPSRGGFF